jgi:ferric-dicitrate binding protein FerR (iron transport regulator)
LRTDLAWLREATRLLNLALNWERAGRRSNRLLSGEDIAEAKRWLATLPSAEQVTELHCDYIKASEQEESVRLDGERARLSELAAASRRLARRTMVGIAIAAVLAGAAGWSAFDATRQRQRAETPASPRRAPQTQGKRPTMRFASAMRHCSRSLAPLPGSRSRTSPMAI